MVVLGGIGLEGWIDGMGMLNWLKSLMRCCSRLMIYWGVLWWYMRKICKAWGSSQGVLLYGGGVGLR